MEIKNSFEGLISRLGMFKERISECEDMPTETSQIEIQRETKILWRKLKRTPNCEAISKGASHTQCQQKKSEPKEIFEVKMADNFPINDRHKTTDPGGSETIKQVKYLTKVTSNCRKSKIFREKIFKPEGENHL